MYKNSFLINNLPLHATIFIQGIVFCFIYGVRIIPDLLAVLVARCLYSGICYIGFGSKIPFTKPFNEIVDAQGWKSLVLMIPIAIMAGIHYFMVANVAYGTIIYLIVLVIMNFSVWKVVFRRAEKS